MATLTNSAFQPLQIINEERVTYGLRYRDYTRYRKHCAHKTHRLRQKLKLTHGKGRDFKKLPPITAEAATDGHLHLLLFEAERAWAHAQELSAPQDSRRSTSRYRRSHDYLSRLLIIARSPALASPLSAQSTIELLIYALIHSARLNLRRPSASTAAYYGLEHRPDEDSAFAHPLIQLCVAYALLDELETAARTSKEVALARAFKDEIGPEVRWCVHEFGRGDDEEDEEGGDSELENHVAKWKTREWDVEGIVGDIAPAYAARVVAGHAALVQRLKTEAAGQGQAGGKKQVLEELVWEGEPVPVRNPELVDALLKVQDALAKLNADGLEEEVGTKAAKAKGGRGKVARYDAVLLSLSDAADHARKIVEAQQASGVAASTGPPRDIHFMHALLTYLHLTHRIARDRVLLAALAAAPPAPKSTAATLHLLAGILQSLAQAAALPLADESPALATALAARLAHAKAQRTLHLARAYAHAALRRHAEALALTQRGLLHVREARALLLEGAGDGDGGADADIAEHVRFYPLDAGALDALAAELAADEARIKLAWFAHNGGAVAVAGADGPSQNPNQNQSQNPNQNQSQNPGENQKEKEKHRKPLFFDIAFNYVELPVDRLRARAGMAPRADAPAGLAAKARAEEEAEEEEAAVQEAPAPRGGLAGFLGSWWGRR